MGSRIVKLIKSCIDSDWPCMIVQTWYNKIQSQTRCARWKQWFLPYSSLRFLLAEWGKLVNLMSRKISISRSGWYLDFFGTAVLFKVWHSSAVQQTLHSLNPFADNEPERWTKLAEQRVLCRWWELFDRWFNQCDFLFIRVLASELSRSVKTVNIAIASAKVELSFLSRRAINSTSLRYIHIKTTVQVCAPWKGLRRKSRSFRYDRSPVRCLIKVEINTAKFWESSCIQIVRPVRAKMTSKALASPGSVIEFWYAWCHELATCWWGLLTCENRSFPFERHNPSGKTPVLRPQRSFDHSIGPLFSWLDSCAWTSQTSVFSATCSLSSHYLVRCLSRLTRRSSPCMRTFRGRERRNQ